MERLKITYSIADQNFSQTKSLGILNYSTQLPAHLAAQPEVEQLTILSNSTLQLGQDLPPNVEVKICDQPLRGKLQRILWDQLGVYTAAKKSGNKWLFLPKGFASFVRRPPVRLAVCVADVMWEHYEKNYPKAISRFEAAYFKRSFFATAKNAEAIFTISDFSTAEVQRVARHKHVKTGPVRTMGIGFVPTEKFKGAKQNTIVVLSGQFPHKRTDLAVDYLSRWQKESGYPGTIHWIGSFPKGLQLPGFPQWKKHHRLSERDYRQILSEARAVVYFSDYEGFGMPPVEAVLAGSCGVYSAIPAMNEVMGDTGYSFQNGSYESFRGAMAAALSATNDKIALWKEQLEQRHSWEHVARNVVSLLASR